MRGIEVVDSTRPQIFTRIYTLPSSPSRHRTSIPRPHLHSTQYIHGDPPPRLFRPPKPNSVPWPAALDASVHGKTALKSTLRGSVTKYDKCGTCENLPRQESHLWELPSLFTSCWHSEDYGNLCNITKVSWRSEAFELPVHDSDTDSDSDWLIKSSLKTRRDIWYE